MKWYAVQTADYMEWDDGFPDYNEAVRMAKKYIEDGEEGVQIAVIEEDENGLGIVCLEEIKPEDF